MPEDFNRLCFSTVSDLRLFLDRNILQESFVRKLLDHDFAVARFLIRFIWYFVCIIWQSDRKIFVRNYKEYMFGLIIQDHYDKIRSEHMF